ncbi:MAG: hypothetical protein FJZ86_15910 [Chloroflexi bacterium]|nr:hypothetical protein [Chloroflexota bacterium]
MKGRDFNIDSQTITIGIWLGGKRADPCFFGNSAGEFVFGKEKFHAGIIKDKGVGNGDWGIGIREWGVENGE